MTVHALLLNASYEPLKVISARRAVSLILSGKASAVEVSDDEYRSVDRIVNVPKVVRLNYQVKVPFRATVPLNRRSVLARDNSTCQYCFKHGDTMDHVIPRSRGGAHAWTNIVTACRKCNAKKDDKMLKEIGWSLKTKPYAPKAWFYVVFKFELDEAWVPYLPAYVV